MNFWNLITIHDFWWLNSRPVMSKIRFWSSFNLDDSSLTNCITFYFTSRFILYIIICANKFISVFMGANLSNQSCIQNSFGYTALIKFLQAWQGSLDKSTFVRTSLMDLVKAYDLPRDLLVVKFETCGIDKTGLKLIHNYLSNP